MITTPLESTQPPETAAKQHASRRSRKKLMVFGAGVLAAIIIITLLRVFVLSPPPVRVSNQVKAAAGVTIVMPTKLPSSFHVSEQPEYQTDRKLVITRFTKSNGDFIALSQQQKPQDVSLKQIDSQETYIDTVGTVYVLKGEAGRIQTIIETSDSWVYVDGSQAVGLSTVKAFIHTLKSE